MATTHIIGTVYKSDGTPYTGAVKFIPDRRIRVMNDATVTGESVETQVTDGALAVDLEPGRYAMIVQDDVTRSSVILVPSDQAEVQLSDIITGAQVEGWGGIVLHDDLSGRDEADQHPISAITGLQSSLNVKAAQADLDAHTADTNNPHQVTAVQAGADPAGTAASEVAAHEAKADPHPQYAEDVDLSNHASDTTLHLTQDERDALTQANSPSTTNPVATIDDISLIPVGLRHFFLTTDDATGYKQTQLDPDTFETASYDFSSITDGQYLMGWITPEDETPEKLLEGPHLLHICAQKTAGTRSIQFYYELYERDSGGTETLINQSSVSVEVPSEISPIAATLYLDALRTLAAGSQLVIKLFAKVTGSGGSPSITIYQSDTQRGFYQEPIDQERLDDRYTTDDEFLAHASSDNVHAITAVIGLQADLLTRGRYWGEFTVADLPTESDGVKPGDTAHVTDALTLDGTGGLFVYIKDNGWVEIHFRTPATTVELDLYRAALDAPWGRYKDKVVLPGWANLYQSSGHISAQTPFSTGSALEAESTSLVSMYADQESKCALLMTPAPNFAGEIRYPLAHSFYGAWRNYDYSGITTPEEAIYALFMCGMKSSTGLISGGLIHTIEYSAGDSSWHHKAYIGILDYDTMQISDAVLISDETVDPANIPTYYYIDANFFLGNYVSPVPTNTIRIEYDGNIYDVDMSSVDANASTRTPIRIGYTRDTGDATVRFFWIERTSTIIMS